MMHPSSAHLQKLRAQIEGSTPAPSLIVITSVKRNDGVTVSAISLADCLASAGYKVALLGTEPDAAAQHGERDSISLPILANELTAGKRSSDTIAMFADKMRREYDFTIVDAEPPMECSISMRLSSIADAVLLAIRIGRTACAEDQATVQALQLAGARVLGVVGVSGAATATEYGETRLRASEPDVFGRAQNAGRATSRIVAAP